MHSPRTHPVTSAPYFLRWIIIILMIAAAATFLHLNHYWPNQTFLSCDRPCHHLDWPMICRIKLTLEEFKVLNSRCQKCRANETECLNRHCDTENGSNNILVANRQMPGPSIQVCENDILVVDVINRLPGKSATVHWRGQTQTESPFMDGAPLITQCPIPSYTTFQYKFRASVSGTHLWHAHAGTDVGNGIFGSLIVKRAEIREPHRSLYDEDESRHVLLLTQSREDSKVTMLVNGKRSEVNGSKALILDVVTGRRSRFRVANAAGAGSCPMVLSVDKHPMILIALDGHPINPHIVTSIVLAKGERADFILQADKPKSSYWMHVRATEKCSPSLPVKAAIIKYVDAQKTKLDKSQIIFNARDAAILEELAIYSNPTNKCQNPDNLCITEIKSLDKMPQSLSKDAVDVQLYLPINYTVRRSNFLGDDLVERKIWSLDNTTFTFPSSPLLTQTNEVDENIICSGDESFESIINAKGNERCHRREDGKFASCDCVHVRRITLDSTVEIILLDQAGLEELVYHLHGYNFHVVGVKAFKRSMTVEEVKELDEKKLLFERNLDYAPLKDTVIVPKFGAVALRFKADNPGYWMLRDEHASEWTRGLDVILKVGDTSDMITAPSDFPKCGSFVGPDYFLI